MVVSVLDDLGEEVTGIVSPVSLCMALTVALVRVLNPTGDASGNTTYFASAYYKEQVGAVSPTSSAIRAKSTSFCLSIAGRRSYFTEDHWVDH